MVHRGKAYENQHKGYIACPAAEGKNYAENACCISRNHPAICRKVGEGERFSGYFTVAPHCMFFCVSIDELLGVEQKRITETIEKYREHSHACLQNGDTEGNLKIWETAYAEFRAIAA